MPPGTKAPSLPPLPPLLSPSPPPETQLQERKHKRITSHIRKRITYIHTCHTYVHTCHTYIHTCHTYIHTFHTYIHTCHTYIHTYKMFIFAGVLTSYNTRWRGLDWPNRWGFSPQCISKRGVISGAVVQDDLTIVLNSALRRRGGASWENLWCYETEV